MTTPEPSTIGGEPWRVASVSVRDLRVELHALKLRTEEVERQVRNARMQDALDLSWEVLEEEYPEIGEMTAEPSEEPFEFWSMTKDAALLNRIKGAIDTLIKITDKLYESQPKDVTA